MPHSPNGTSLVSVTHNNGLIFLSSFPIFTVDFFAVFVVMTADAGYCLAPVQFEHFTFFLATTGIGLCSCCANSLNQVDLLSLTYKIIK